MAEPAPPPTASALAQAARGPGLAAGIGVVMVLLSTSMAVVSGVLLWRGDPGNEVMNTLPEGCEVLAVAEQPLAAPRVLGAAVDATAGLPAAVTAVLGALRDAAMDRGWPLGAAPPLATGFDARSGAAVCWRGDAALWTLGVEGPDGAAALLDAWRGRLGGGSWRASQAVGGFVEYGLRRDNDDEAKPPRASALAGASRLQVLAGPADPATALALAVRSLSTASLRTDVVMRGALERIGAGGLQFVLARAEARRASRWAASLPPLRAWIAEHSDWLGLALRDDLGDGRLHAHLHLGSGHAGAAALKEALDIGLALPTSAALRGAAAGGVLRLRPAAVHKALPALLGVPGVAALAAALRDAGAADLAALASAAQGTILLRVAGATESGAIEPGATKSGATKPSPTVMLALRLAAAVSPQALCPPGSGARAAFGCAADATWFVVAAGGRDAAARGLALLRERPGPDAAASDDRQRILDDSMGGFVDDPAGLGAAGLPRWPRLEAEAIWLDTGLVLHLAVQSRAEP